MQEQGEQQEPFPRHTQGTQDVQRVRVNLNLIHQTCRSQSPFSASPVLAVLKDRQLRGPALHAAGWMAWSLLPAMGRAHRLTGHIGRVLTHFLRGTCKLRASGVEGESSQRPVMGRNGAGCFL